MPGLLTAKGRCGGADDVLPHARLRDLRHGGYRGHHEAVRPDRTRSRPPVATTLAELIIGGSLVSMEIGTGQGAA